MLAKPEKRGASVFTSNVSNECQELFRQKVAENRKKNKDPDLPELVSQNDVLYIMRGIGMNPTQEELEQLVKEMLPMHDVDDKDKKKDKGKKGKDDKKKDEKEEEGEKEKKKPIAPEDIPKYCIDDLNKNLEKVYKNQRRCEEDIVEAFKVFDAGRRPGEAGQGGDGEITLGELCTIMTEMGDDVLSHGFGGEVQELKRLFGNADGRPCEDPNEADMNAVIKFSEFAKTMQEAKRPEPQKPATPPPEDEITPGQAGSRKPSVAP